LAAGRRRLGPRCEAQWARPSGPHDLHFAQKEARRGTDAWELGFGLGLVKGIGCRSVQFKVWESETKGRAKIEGRVETKARVASRP
jgi:hypothetical protein